MKHLKLSLGIFFILAASRFIPHPPNFTTLITLSFYVPAFLGIKFIPIVLLSFALTDIYFGMHATTLFTWGSVFFIGFISKYLFSNIFKRIIGAFCGACIFYLISNFGVWAVSGYYEINLNGLILSYSLALPFFYNSIASTMIFSLIIEGSFKLSKIYKNYFKSSLS
tara:strand:- start:707 stop:1207 length:501 start_codon:yes stop_codon:yes gene_type:complete